MMTSAWLLQGWGDGGGVISPLPPDTIVSPASIIAQLLIDELVLSTPANDPLLDWPVYVDGQPASGSPSGSSVVPVEVVGVFNVAGVTDAKDMDHGKVWEHEGITILVRCEYPDEGYAKAKQIRDKLDSITNSEVAIGGETWRVLNISRTIGIAGLGQDKETRETLFSINYTVSLRQIV